VKHLPNQTTEAVGDRTDGLRVSEARDEPAIGRERRCCPSPSRRRWRLGSAHGASDGCPWASGGCS
jgi:hypothetical protein